MLLLTITVILLLCYNVNGSHHERRLYTDLLRDYNALERPIINHSLPILVKLKVSLQQIIDVDEKNQVLNVNAWLDYVRLPMTTLIVYEYLMRSLIIVQLIIRH